MPLEELGLMFCVWLAWAGQLAHMALLSEREDELCAAPRAPRAGPCDE